MNYVQFFKLRVLEFFSLDFQIPVEIDATKPAREKIML